MNKSELINKSLERLPEHKRNGFITAVNGLEPILLFDFFMWFRANGEKHMDLSIEKMIEIYLKESKNE